MTDIEHEKIGEVVCEICFPNFTLVGQVGPLVFGFNALNEPILLAQPCHGANNLNIFGSGGASTLPYPDPIEGVRGDEWALAADEFGEALMYEFNSMIEVWILVQDLIKAGFSPEEDSFPEYWIFDQLGVLLEAFNPKLTAIDDIIDAEVIEEDDYLVRPVIHQKSI